MHRLILIFFFLLSGWSENGCIAQDLIYHFTCRHYKTPLAVDSVKILNLNNNTSLILTDIPEGGIFSVNLTHQQITLPVIKYLKRKSDEIKLVQKTTGMLKLLFYKKGKVKVDIFTISGQKVFSGNFLNPGNALAEITVGGKGIYLVRVAINRVVFSEKVIGFSTLSNCMIKCYEYEPSGNYPEVRSGIIKKSGFIFEAGDSLIISVFKNDYLTDYALTKVAGTDSFLFQLEKKGFYYLGKNYKTVVINGKEWMAENLAVNIGEGCWAYDNNESNVKKYGRLYSWKKANEVCPKNWHLPGDEEWEELAEFISDDNGGYSKSSDDWYGVGKHLKTTNNWQLNGNGTNDYGFSGIPGGYRTIDGEFGALNHNGFWWSSTEASTLKAWYWYLYSIDTYLHRHLYEKGTAISVRCVKND